MEGQTNNKYTKLLRKFVYCLTNSQTLLNAVFVQCATTTQGV